MLKLLEKHNNFIKYCCIGVVGVTLDFLVFLFLTSLGLNYQISNVISVSCGITNNFFLNRHFNFKVKDDVLKRFLKFYSVGVVGIILSAVTLHVLIELLNTNLLVAKGFTIFVVTLVQYTLNKRYSFKKTNLLES